MSLPEYLRRLRTSRAPLRYSVAAALCTAALALTAVLEPAMLRASGAPLFAAVLVIAWLLGFGPAIPATAFGVVVLRYLADESSRRWRLDERDVFWMLLFFVTVLTMAWLASAIRRLEDERTRLLGREQRAHATAAAANRARDDFLAIVTHELRTPLTAIRGWLQLLRSGRLTPGQTEHAIETLERNVRLQAKLIEDLLDVSRAAAGKLDVTLRPVDLVRIAQQVVDSHVPLAAEAGVTLMSRLAGPAAVLGDGERLQQVMNNLVANAIKFTPTGGHVEVTVAREAGAPRIVVQDTGEGIEPALLPHIFDRFRQGQSGVRRPEGLGLGLAIVKYIVQAHGGTVRAESAGPGRGATFVVDLPLDA
jgi:signal transduction histidine kinase